jgi:hypothetical protein
MRDPDWAWAPWELTADGVEAGLRALGVFSTHARFVMRFYNTPRLSDASLPPDAGFTEEVELPSWIGARYLLLGRPDTFHAVAVGLCDPAGRFHALARSPWVRAPRSRPSPPCAAPRFITTTRATLPDGTARLSTSSP